jgi:hypothetical protein
MAARGSPCGSAQTFGLKSSSVTLFNRTPLRRMHRITARSPIRAAADDRTVTLLDYGENFASLIRFICPRSFYQYKDICISFGTLNNDILTIILSSIAQVLVMCAVFAMRSKN